MPLGWAGYTMADEIFDFFYRGQAITIGSDLYIRALVSPSSRGGGGTETNYGGYARFTLVRSTGVFPAANGTGARSNIVDIAFPSATTLGNGNIVAFDIVNTPSGSFSKVYNGGPVLPAIVMVVGKAPTAEIGMMQISF